MMEYFFDGIIFAIILFCFISAKEPKQTALLVCLLVALSGHICNQYLGVEYLYSSLAIAESIGAASIMMMSFKVSQGNKTFFYLMSGFLTASVINNGLLVPAYKYAGVGSFHVYTICYQAIAVCHILTMLAYSDVIRNAVGAFRGCNDNHNVAVRDLRGDA